MDISENKSEVARILWEIERTCEAMQRVANDPGFSASHEAVRRRYQSLGRQQQELARYVGEEKATDMMCDMYNNAMKQEDGMTKEEAGANEHSGDEILLLEQDASDIGDKGRQVAHISVEGGEPRLLIITLPEFQRGYEAGKQASIEHDEQPFLIDRELIDILKDFVAEGLFSDVDEAPLHWHIGNLCGLIERTALHSGKRVQRVIVQVRENLTLTVSLIPI